MTLAISTTYAKGELIEKLLTIKQAGFEAVELAENDLVNFEGNIEDIDKLISSHGLKVNALEKFADLEGLKNQEREQAFTRLTKKLELVKKIGGTCLLLTSTTHSKANPDIEKIAIDLREAGEYAQKYGIHLAYLALPWATNTKTEEAALELINIVNHPNLGLGLNSLFSLGNGCKVAKLRTIPTEKIFHIQIADVPHLNLSPRYLSQNSLLPGQGVLNLAGFIALITRGGYRGDWTLSPLSDTIISQPKVTDAYRALVNLLDEVERMELGISFSIPKLSERSITNGFEYIEFATSYKKQEQNTLTNMLNSMGFRPERHHRSKEIILWRQGAINLMVNSHNDGHAHDRFNEHGTCVSSMGLRVKNANQTVERATKLGAKIFHETVGSGEIALPSIRGVGDHLVHFIDENSNLHQMWNINFETLPITEVKAPIGLRRIDHVAQTMEYNEMQSWLLYYLSTFYMTKSSIIDVADPLGIIRSQTLSTAEGEVRLNLNSSNSKETMVGNFLKGKLGSGVQHIAFLSDDIFESSKKLEDYGFKRLGLPANYYRDLETTFGLDGELLAKLIAGNICYDRDETGEYFQIFSLPVFNGFFFEIVERRNKYDGYGARNAPFRIKAQMKYAEKYAGVTYG